MAVSVRPAEPLDYTEYAELAHLAEQAASCNPFCCGAAATVTSRDGAVGKDGEPATAVTHPDLSPLVSVQWESGEGPIPAALDSGGPTEARDLLYDERWPGYRAKALEAGVRSSTTLPFRRDGLAVTLTVYCFRPGPLEDGAHDLTALLGDLASTGLARDHQYRQVLAENDQLDTALRSRPVVDQARGIIMYVLGCGPETAFALLRRMSQRTNRKLSELAEALVDTRGHGAEREIRALAERLQPEEPREQGSCHGRESPGPGSRNRGRHPAGGGGLPRPRPPR